MTPNASDIFYQILGAIKSGQPEWLQYSDLAPKDSAVVLDSLFDPRNGFEDYRFRVHFSAPDRYLRVMMPTRLHEAGASWFAKQYAQWRVNGLIDDVGEDFLGLQPSPRITNFTGHWSGSIKHPNYSVIPDGPNGYPTHFPSVVLESSWIDTGMDDCRLWHEGSRGHVRVVILDLFPVPNPVPANPTLTIEELFGGCTPSGHIPETKLTLELIERSDPIY
ncbi:hypothetical protein B9Z19DRAFT_1063949 [Tuber borchii]|uniref:Uncharacterized protein n=1 Tax=Tuber borchii TaxID=42251 RepID=A0A2T6ZWF9_TUBBO|nr:hypothetical protein B9Z19DRAFT_1063949 [Tuber borchii]